MRTNPVGARLRWLRESVGASAREIDRLAGLHECHLSVLENAKHDRVSAKTLTALAGVYGVSLDWLIRGIGEPPLEEHVRKAVDRARRRTTKGDSIPPPPRTGTEG